MDREFFEQLNTTPGHQKRERIRELERIMNWTMPYGAEYMAAEKELKRLRDDESDNEDTTSGNDSVSD